MHCAGSRHQASSSPHGDGRPCCCGCTLQTTYDWPHRCTKRKTPAHPSTGHASCGSPWAMSTTPLPYSSHTVGWGFFLRCCCSLGLDRNQCAISLLLRCIGCLEEHAPSSYDCSTLLHYS